MTDRKPVRNIEFYSKNKFEKLVHLVGFIIRVQHSIISTVLQGDCSRNCDLILSTARKLLVHDIHISSEEHTQHPIQCVMGVHSMGTKQARYKADHTRQRKAGTCCHRNAEGQKWCQLTLQHGSF
jgi:hypothetical protein